LGSAGKVCDNTDSLEVIKTYEECREAVDYFTGLGILANEWDPTDDYKSTGTGFVGGCSVKHSNDDLLHFNSNIDYQEGRSSETPVCRCAGYPSAAPTTPAPSFAPTRVVKFN
jgi:hypothetical protein